MEGRRIMDFRLFCCRDRSLAIRDDEKEAAPKRVFAFAVAPYVAAAAASIADPIVLVIAVRPAPETAVAVVAAAA